MLRRAAVAVAVLLALGLVAGLGGYLVHQQKQAADNLNQAFAERAALTATLFDDTLKSSRLGRDDIAPGLDGPASAIQERVAGADMRGLTAVAVLDGQGEVLGALPSWFAGPAKNQSTQPAYRRALQEGRAIWDGVTSTRAGIGLVVHEPFQSADGPRMFLLLLPLGQLTSFGEAYLSTLNVIGAQAYVVDDEGKVIVSSMGAAAGQPVPDPVLASALKTKSAGVAGEHYFAAAAVGTGLWRVVFVTTEQALQQPLSSSRRVSWQLFGAFATAMSLMLLIGGVCLHGSARLAHARRHDALTGLPNRSLFVERTEQAIQDRGRNGPVAAIFIDLDGFKPVNDTHGHAVGDRLLRAVSERLKESMRPGDWVSRFGGDEFLVLCRNLRDPGDVLAVAERLREYIAEPYEIDHQILLIGSSMGVALTDDATADAAALIHNADLAMYKAKKGGRGRIEMFSPATEAEMA